jgi:hypothetical protein
MPRNRALRAVFSAVAISVAAGSLSGCASTASTSGADAADAATIAARASVNGIAPELVFAIAVDGFDLAPQSVGAVDEAGMSATWFNQATGGMLTIRTGHGEMTAESCMETPLWDAPGTPDECTDEDGAWHRTGGGVHEYVAVRDDASVRVTGSNTEPSDLSAAAKSVHVPTDAELEHLFSDLPTVAPTPVERGDLPDHGDGAPIDPQGPGG